jgi:hypothetical protein
MTTLFGSGRIVLPLALFSLSLSVLLRTVAPTVYALDSGEFVIAAKQLGIVHGPGYPLYLMVLHIFLRLPIGDLGFRGNLFSALCLAATVPVLYTFLVRIVTIRWIAAITTLLWVWSYYVWSIGLFAEVYAPQLFTLSLFGWALLKLKTEHPHPYQPLGIGALFGIAVAMCPSSVLFAPGLVVAFLQHRISWQLRITSAALALVLFVTVQLYFPWRYAAQPAFNLAGTYDANGSFQPIRLDTLSGLTWFIAGGQFEGLFFEEGIIPTGEQISQVFQLYNHNFLGFGLVLGIVGAVALIRQSKQGFGLWLIFFAPYTYFYTTYGAGDKQLMFGPSFLLWTVPLAFGLRWMMQRLSGKVVYGLLALPIISLVIFWPQLDLSTETSVHQRAEVLLERVPPHAVIFGQWHDLVPVQYLYYLEGRRSDVRLINLFLFPQPNLARYLDHLTALKEPVVFISSRLNPDAHLPSSIAWLFSRYGVDTITLNFGSEPPLDLFLIHSQP